MSTVLAQVPEFIPQPRETTYKDQVLQLHQQSQKTIFEEYLKLPKIEKLKYEIAYSTGMSGTHQTFLKNLLEQAHFSEDDMDEYPKLVSMVFENKPLSETQKELLEKTKNVSNYVSKYAYTQLKRQLNQSLTFFVKENHMTQEMHARYMSLPFFEMVKLQRVLIPAFTYSQIYLKFIKEMPNFFPDRTSYPNNSFNSALNAFFSLMRGMSVGENTLEAMKTEHAHFIKKTKLVSGINNIFNFVMDAAVRMIPGINIYKDGFTVQAVLADLANITTFCSLGLSQFAKVGVMGQSLRTIASVSTAANAGFALYFTGITVKAAYEAYTAGHETQGTVFVLVALFSAYGARTAYKTMIQPQKDVERILNQTQAQKTPSLLKQNSTAVQAPTQKNVEPSLATVGKSKIKPLNPLQPSDVLTLESGGEFKLSSTNLEISHDTSNEIYTVLGQTVETDGTKIMAVSKNNEMVSFFKPLNQKIVSLSKPMINEFGEQFFNDGKIMWITKNKKTLGHVLVGDEAWNAQEFLTLTMTPEGQIVGISKLNLTPFEETKSVIVKEIKPIQIGSEMKNALTSSKNHVEMMEGERGLFVKADDQMFLLGKDQKIYKGTRSKEEIHFVETNGNKEIIMNMKNLNGFNTFKSKLWGDYFFDIHTSEGESLKDFVYPSREVDGFIGGHGLDFYNCSIMSESMSYWLNGGMITPVTGSHMKHALESGKNISFSTISEWFSTVERKFVNGKWENIKTPASLIELEDVKSVQTYLQSLDNMESVIIGGDRGLGSMGHVFNARREGNRIVYYDMQINLVTAEPVMLMDPTYERFYVIKTKEFHIQNKTTESGLEAWKAKGALNSIERAKKLEVYNRSLNPDVRPVLTNTSPFVQKTDQTKK